VIFIQGVKQTEIVLY